VVTGPLRSIVIVMASLDFLECVHARRRMASRVDVILKPGGVALAKFSALSRLWPPRLLSPFATWVRWLLVVDDTTGSGPPVEALNVASHLTPNTGEVPIPHSLWRHGGCGGVTSGGF
jgi:hypothetical protein